MCAVFTQTYTFANGQTADGGQVQTEITALGNSVNNIVDAQVATGAVIGSSDSTKLRNTMLGYAEITANFTGAAGTTAVTDVTGLSVTVTVPTGGRRIKITGYANMYNQTSAADLYFYIRESTTELNHADQQAGAANDVNMVTVMWVGTPSAGSHTYKLSISSNVAGPNIGAAATNPAFILVETF